MKKCYIRDSLRRRANRNKAAVEEKRKSSGRCGWHRPLRTFRCKLAGIMALQGLFCNPLRSTWGYDLYALAALSAQPLPGGEKAFASGMKRRGKRMPAACLQRKGQFYTRNACLRACGASGANGIFQCLQQSLPVCRPFPGFTPAPGESRGLALHTEAAGPPLGHSRSALQTVYRRTTISRWLGVKGADVHTVLCGKEADNPALCQTHGTARTGWQAKERNAVFPRIDGAARTPQALASTACFISRWLRSCYKRSPNIWFSPPFSMHIITCLFSNFSCKNDIKLYICRLKFYKM